MEQWNFSPVPISCTFNQTLKFCQIYLVAYFAVLKRFNDRTTSNCC
uniref:Uncharacterized protein n=1 Tax=Anguilla anguilla TaxID=7936 RepID=A0A0E9WZK9_ANGAN